MAGAGAKLFTSGSVLTADQVNTFLMDQSIMRFTSTTTRDAAFGGAGEPTLAEGMFAYTTDTNTLWLYDGAAWVAAVNASSLNGVGNWTSYTPVLTAVTTNPTLGSGSVAVGYYAQIGKVVIYSFQIVFGTSGVNAGSGDYRVSLPVTAAFGSAFYGATNGQTIFFDKSANSLYFANAWLGTTTYLSMLFQTTTNPSPVATLASNNPVVVSTEDAISGLIIYQAA
jgi:hypothetical protein